MSKTDDKSKRIDMRFPSEILTRIDTHKCKQAHTTRTQAVLDLIRKGLESYEKERAQSVKVGAGFLRVKGDTNQ